MTGIVSTTGKKRTKRRPGLAAVLSLALATLVILTVGAVFGVGLWSAVSNTKSLLSQNVNLLLQTAVEAASRSLSPAPRQAAFVAGRIDADPTLIDDRGRLAEIMRATIAASEQMTTMAMLWPRGGATAVRRLTDGELRIIQSADAPPFASVRAEFGAGETTMWGPPTYVPALQTTALNYRRIVGAAEAPIGILAVGVSVRDLSRRLVDMSTALGANPFVLYGRDHVLAHTSMVDGYDGLSLVDPLPETARFSDKTLAHIWDQQDSEAFEGLDLAPGTEVRFVKAPGANAEASSVSYVFSYRQFAGFSDAPLIIGGYFRRDDVDDFAKRIIAMLIVGGVALVVAVVCALLLARLIARPVARVARASEAVSALDLKHVAELPPSPIRELDRLASAFNDMVRGLRWLEIYVPRKLVSRLMRFSADGAAPSRDAVVTVMFTDMAGFTSWSEGRPAADVAAYLNRHFALLAECVNGEDGTVDKYIGDALMAFWGVPFDQNDHAERACRAALAMADALARQAAENPGVTHPTVRIGVHSGPVTVGNIGSPDRMNYTIVGDTVNVCQRIEQMNKSLPDAGGGAEARVSILISRETRARIGRGFATAEAGRFEVRGRREHLLAYRLTRGRV